MTRSLIAICLAAPAVLLLPSTVQADGPLTFCPHGHESCIPIWEMTTQDVEQVVKRAEKTSKVSCQRQKSGRPQLHRWRCEVVRHGVEGMLFVRVNRSNSVFVGSGKGVKAFVITSHGPASP